MERYDDEGDTLVCPVYEADYGIQKIRLCNNIYSNMTDVCVGDIKDIYINPDNPEECYDGQVNPEMALILGGMGLMFIALPAVGYFMMLKG